jgi:hypothetical protein
VVNIYHSGGKYLQPYHRGGKYLPPRWQIFTTLPPLWQISTTAVANIQPYHRGGKSGEKEIQFKRIKSYCIKKIMNKFCLNHCIKKNHKYFFFKTIVLKNRISYMGHRKIDLLTIKPQSWSRKQYDLLIHSLESRMHSVSKYLAFPFQQFTCFCRWSYRPFPLSSPYWC